MKKKLIQEKIDELTCNIYIYLQSEKENYNFWGT